MAFIDNYNKLNKINNNVDSNKVLISQLDYINIKKNTVVFVKQQQEIILVENQLIPYGSTWITSYQFENLDIKYLQFLYPYTILSTESAYDFSTALVSIYNYCWWENYNNSLILKIRADGILYGSISPIVYAPVYLTAKIKVYNQNLYKSFKFKN